MQNSIFLSQNFLNYLSQMLCAYWHLQYYPNPRLPTDTHIQRQFLFKEKLFKGWWWFWDTLFHKQERPSVAINLNSSGRERHGGSFSAPFPPGIIYPCDSMLLLRHFLGSRCPQDYRLMAPQVPPPGTGEPVPTVRDGFFRGTTPPDTWTRHLALGVWWGGYFPLILGLFGKRRQKLFCLAFQQSSQWGPLLMSWVQEKSC